MLTDSESQTQNFYRGLYHGNYQLNQSLNEGSSTVGRAFVLPGQGSSFPGMFANELTRIAQFRNIFRLADQLAAFFDLLPISNYILNPAILPPEKIHIYRNCALYCVEVASVQYLLDKGLRASAATGHSFGECASLVASAILDFETMFSVVVHRNLACPPANELGSMIALTGTEDKINQVLSIPGVYLANRNSLKQMVIAVSTEAKGSAVQCLRKLRLPHIPLTQLPQPYHSPLMEPYRHKIAERLKSLKLKPATPQFDVYSWVSHSWIDASNYQSIDYVDLLSRQITEPVDFVDQILKVRERGAVSFYEVGPGRMLESSIRAIVNDGQPLVYRSVESALDVFEREKLQPVVKNEKLAESKWFQKIKDVVKSVTGYKDDEIQIEQSFQRDLGIDSIKKAEILFKIISQENLGSNSDFSITRFSTIYQAVEYLEAYSEQTDPLRSEHLPELTLSQPVWTPEPGWAHHSLKQKAKDHTIAEIDFNAGFFATAVATANRLASSGLKPLVIVRAHASSPNLESIIENIQRDFKSAVADESSMSFGLAFVDQTDGLHAATASLLKSLRKEWAKLALITIQSSSTNGIHPTDAEILNDFIFSQSRNLRYDGKVRSILDYQAMAGAMSQENRTQPCAGIFVGGSSGIAYEILKRMPVVTGDRMLVLGRRSDTHPEVAEAIAVLKSRWVDFEYQQVDAMDKSALDAAFEAEIKRSGRLDFVVNACGYQLSQAFGERTVSDLANERASKLVPFENIRSITKKLKVKRVIHFSSFVAAFGNAGQTVYASSNAEIESRCLRDHGQMALAWGPWENVGMTTNHGVLQKIRENGISLITPEVGAQFMTRLLFGQKIEAPVLYAMDLKDVFLMSADRPKSGEHAELVGELQNRFEGVFYKDVDSSKETFLNDHVILNKNVLPAAYFMAQMFHLSRMQFSRPVSVMDVNIQNVSILENGLGSLKLQSFNRAPFEVKVYSLLPHCTARFEPTRKFKASTPSEFKRVRSLNVRDLYGAGSVFDMGPSFQMIREAEVDVNKSVRVFLDLERNSPMSGENLFDFHLTLFETAFQSLTLEMGYQIGKVTLPNQVGAVDFDPSIAVSSRISVTPRVKSITDQFCIADIDFANDKGEIFGRFENARVSLHVRSANQLRFFKMNDADDGLRRHV